MFHLLQCAILYLKLDNLSSARERERERESPRRRCRNFFAESVALKFDLKWHDDATPATVNREMTELAY